MNTHAKIAETAAALIKSDPDRPVLIVTGPRSISIRGGTVFAGHLFASDVPVQMPDEPVIGDDYGVAVVNGMARAWRAISIPFGEGCIGGFHFAPGGNATGNAGGDDAPAINPCSLWDLNFRPACPDPRGMTLVKTVNLAFWADIYLLGKKHLTDGTSKFGVVIADHWDAPQNPAGGTFQKLDYETAKAVMAHHSKGLLSEEEFRAFAEGVTERTSLGTDPKITGLDAKRTSQAGGMQSSGNMWVWGIDKKLRPRASVFGGSWLLGANAGSRYASVGDWPERSAGSLGARGRSDHLQPVPALRQQRRQGVAA